MMRLRLHGVRLAAAVVAWAAGFAAILAAAAFCLGWVSIVFCADIFGDLATGRCRPVLCMSAASRPPWSVDEADSRSFIVRDANGQQVAYVFE